MMLAFLLISFLISYSSVLTAVESILVLPPRLVRNLQTCASQVGIFEQVDIGTLVKPVMRWVIRWRTVEVMDVTKAMKRNHQLECARRYRVSMRSMNRQYLQRADVLLTFTGGHLCDQ